MMNERILLEFIGEKYLRLGTPNMQGQ